MNQNKELCRNCAWLNINSKGDIKCGKFMIRRKNDASPVKDDCFIQKTEKLKPQYPKRIFDNLCIFDD